jgi:hypothetical protein
LPVEIGNRQEPDLTTLSILAKSFCVALRRHHADENLAALREFFDPRYLKKYNLTEGRLTFATASVRDIFSIQVAQDRCTLVCIVNTHENEKELLLFRATVHEGKLYLQPPLPPEPRTQKFTPWLLRTKV